MKVEDNIHNYLATIGYNFTDHDISGGSRFYSKDEDEEIMVLIEKVE